MDFFDAVENQSPTALEAAQSPSAAPRRGDFFDAVENPQGYLASRASTFDPQEQRLRETKAKYAGVGEDVPRFIMRNMLPGASAAFNWVQERKYRKAVERYNAGQASQEDLDIIAQNQRLEEIRQNEGTGRAVLRGLAGVPAIAVEFGLGVGPTKVGRYLPSLGPALGAIKNPGLRVAATPLLVPSMGLPQDIERRARISGTSPADIGNVAPAYGMQALNALVLGQLQKRVQAAPRRTQLGKASQAAKAGGLGVAESAGVNAAAKLIDDVLDEAGVDKKARLGATSGHGAFGAFLRGEHGEGWKHLAVEFVTFAAFARLHSPEYQDQLAARADRGGETPGIVPRGPEGPGSARPPEGPGRLPGGEPPSGKGEVFDAFVKTHRKMASDGLRPETAQAYIKAVVVDPLTRLRENPNATTEDAIRLFDQLPDGPLKDLGIAAARAGGFRTTVRQEGVPTPGARPAELPAPDARGSTESGQPVSGTAHGISPRTPSEPSRALAAPEPTRPPESPAEATPEPQTTGERFYRVPSSKSLTEPNIEQARSELMGSFAGKWFSNTREGNEQYFTEGKVQFEFDPSKADAEFLKRGERDSTLGSRNPMYLDPALTAIRYRGKETDPDFASFRDLIEGEGGFNAARAEAGLPPIVVEVVPPKGSHGKTVEQVPPESKPEPQKPQTLLERLRARQKQQPPATAKTAAPVSPAAPKSEAPVSGVADAAFDAAGTLEAVSNALLKGRVGRIPGLSKGERHAIRQVLEGKSLREIADEPGFPAADSLRGEKYKGQPSYETVRNMLERASKALGGEDKQIRAKIDEALTEAKIGEVERRIAEAEESGEPMSPEEAHEGQRVLEPEERAARNRETSYNALIDQMMKEIADAGGQLSPEREAFYKREAARFDRAETGRGPSEEGAAPESPPAAQKGVRTKPKLTGKRKPAEPVGEGESWRDRLAFNGADLSDPAAVRKAWEKMDTRERGDFARQVGSVYRDASPAERAEIRDAFIAAVPHAKSEGKPGSVEKFDSTRHDSGESAVVPGDPVRVVEPALVISGYLNGKGGRYVVGKAIVEPQRPAEPAAEPVRQPEQPSSAGEARRFGGGPRGRAGKLVVPSLRDSVFWQTLKKGGLALRKLIVRWLTSFGDLGPAVFRAKIAMDGRIAAYAQDVLNAARDFYRAVGDYSKLTAAEVGAIRAALEGDAAALAGLRPEVATVVKSMRAHIDALSNALIRVGAIQGKLAGAVEENLGFYLHRSYRVFKDPKWAEKVPEDVKNRFKAWLRAEYVRAGSPRSEGEIDGVMWKLLTNGTAAENPIAFLARSKLGSKDLGIITRRKDVPAELRALWGEVADPLATYAETITRQAHLLANHVFQKQVAEIGLREGFLSRTPTEKLRVEIAPEGSETMGPLAGLHTTPEMKRAFGEVYAKDQLPAAWAAARTLLGLAKYSKTVLSPVTHLRNFFGGTFAAIANGHFRISAIVPTLRVLATDTAAARKAHRRLVELGIIGDGVGEREMKLFAQDVLKLRDADATSAMGRLADKLRKGIGLAEKAYRVEDSFWKVYFFENEKANYRKAHPEWTERQVEEKAAEIVRNTYQTYSMLPKLVKAQRLNPVTAPFLAFPSEVVRNTYHTIRLGVSEMRNPATREIGIRRLIGLGAALGLAGTLGAITRNMTGLTTDDEDAMRRFLPWWSRNSELVHLGQDESGNRKYVDIGSTDYYSFLKRPVIAALSDSPENTLYELSDPVLGEQLFTQRLFDVVRNQKREGGPVVNPQMPWAERKLTQLGHLGGALVPGAVESGRRVGLAAQGKQYDLEREATAAATGQRVQSLDLPKSLGFKARRFDRAMSEASSIYSRGEGDQPAVDAIRRGIFDEMQKDIRAAEQLGMNRQQIWRLLRENGVSARDAYSLIQGTYPGWRPSPRLEKSRAARATR